MAKHFNQVTNKELPFGPVDLTEKKPGELTNKDMKEYKRNCRKEQKQISIGYNRIQEKVTLLRESFSTAVMAGNRSRSGKLVCDYYDALKDIWGGSPTTKPLSTGVHSSEINDQSRCLGLSDTENESSVQEEEICGDDLNLSIESTHDADQNRCPDLINNPTQTC